MAKRTSKKCQRGKSFRLVHREDLKRELKVPSVFRHFAEMFKIVFGNWRVFIPLFIIAVLAMFLVVGFPSLETVVTSSFIGLSLWLITIFLIRHLLAGQEVSVRDGLYNALTPLISSIVVFMVAVVQSLPIVLLVVAYSSAVETNFLATPFYGFLFFTFAALMVLLSGYLLSSTLVALVAVSAPGLYPLKALKTASELMKGRRIKFILRVAAFLILAAIIWFVILVPAVLIVRQIEYIDTALFTEGMITILGAFTVILAAAYFYLYYRWMIDADVVE